MQSLNQATSLSKSAKLNDGPVAVAKLPYVLPLGFHGKFVNA
jgi:carotenoid cleavage dioxygenase-like enzyme